MNPEGADLETNYKFSLRKAHEHMCHLSITRWCDEATTELVAFSSVESSGDCGFLEGTNKVLL